VCGSLPFRRFDASFFLAKSNNRLHNGFFIMTDLINGRKRRKTGESMNKPFISTGRAAKLLSVAPDTVLRWIKQGKIPARRTVGGHYRIWRSSVEAILDPAKGRPQEMTGKDCGTILYCWESNSIDGRISEDCLSCAVYQARESGRHEAGERLRQKGRGEADRSTICEECPHYKDRKPRPINVLVITDNEELKSSLGEEAAVFSRFNIRYTSCEYECSAIVDSFRPEYVVVDCAMDWRERQEFCLHLSSDPRIPNVKIILAVSADRGLSNDLLGSLSVIGKPFALADLENYVENFYSLTEIQEGGDESMDARASQTTPTELSADGFLAQLKHWDTSTAEELAKINDIWPLTERHWMIIEYVHKYYKEHRTGPPVVKISHETGLSMEQICKLFPCGVVKGAYRLAGLPRPSGCA
jgi:tRNA 2-thiouridine synthesizing protein E